MSSLYIIIIIIRHDNFTGINAGTISTYSPPITNPRKPSPPPPSDEIQLQPTTINYRFLAPHTQFNQQLIDPGYSTPLSLTQWLTHQVWFPSIQTVVAGTDDLLSYPWTLLFLCLIFLEASSALDTDGDGVAQWTVLYSPPLYCIRRNVANAVGPRPPLRMARLGGQCHIHNTLHTRWDWRCYSCCTATAAQRLSCPWSRMTR